MSSFYLIVWLMNQSTEGKNSNLNLASLIKAKLSYLSEVAGWCRTLVYRHSILHRQIFLVCVHRWTRVSALCDMIRPAVSRDSSSGVGVSSWFTAVSIRVTETVIAVNAAGSYSCTETCFVTSLSWHREKKKRSSTFKPFLSEGKSFSCLFSAYWLFELVYFLVKATSFPASYLFNLFSVIGHFVRKTWRPTALCWRLMLISVKVKTHR